MSKAVKKTISLPADLAAEVEAIASITVSEPEKTLNQISLRLDSKIKPIESNGIHREYRFFVPRSMSIH